MGGWVRGVEKLILKLTSASTGVGVEARAELGNLIFFEIHRSIECVQQLCSVVTLLICN